jgi:hypothetical protein
VHKRDALVADLLAQARSARDKNPKELKDTKELSQQPAEIDRHR